MSAELVENVQCLADVLRIAQIRESQRDARAAQQDVDVRIDAKLCTNVAQASKTRYMTAIFELPLPSETLAADELSEITGSKTHDGQRTWLDANRWKYHTNRAGRPIVGRMYARLKLAGIEASALTPQAWAPDFSGIG